MKLQTWGGRSEFTYSGSVNTGVEILYGQKPNRQKVTSAQFSALLNHFKGRIVNIGTSRTNPPHGSLGEWLQVNVTKTATASYVGPILIQEKCAERIADKPLIRFSG